MKKEEKYILVSEIIRKEIGDYLKNKNYVFTNTEVIFGINNSDNFHVYFTNLNKKRTIEFSYTYLNFRNEVDEYFVIFITRKPHGIYSIEDILKYEKKKYDTTKFFLLNYEGAFEQQVKQFCDFIIGLFEEYLQRWLSGEIWEEIPFDWGRYK